VAGVIGIGTVIQGKYRLVRALGDGGMGAVFEGEHVVLGTLVAVKVLHPEMVRRPEIIQRFLQEARVAAQIRSAHVVRVLDVDRTPAGDAYIVMELLQGESLAALLDRQRKLTTVIACEYARQILDALEAAHSLGIVHRDLKPENVFVTIDGGKETLKLIDFGIAKARQSDPSKRGLTVAGAMMGTPEYMAPEQARSADRVDARADIYAAGVMLFEMLSGKRPVSGDDARVVAFRVERGDVEPLVRAAPEVPRELAGLVHRAMAPQPELRFSTATEMRLALERLMPGSQVSTASMGLRALPSPSTATAMAETSVPQIGFIDGGSREGESGPRTVQAPPIAVALATPWYVPATPAAAQSPQPGRRVQTPIVLIAIIPLLLGAAIVSILVGLGVIALPAPEPNLGLVSASPSASDLVVTPAPAVSSAIRSEVPTLGPTRSPPSYPAPHPVPSARPPSPSPSTRDAEAPSPPFVFPSALPNISNVLGLPSGFPTSLPGLIPGWTRPSTPSPPSSGQ